MCFVFVFAALLEYAAVNYTYWGARAKKKSKKKDNEEQKVLTSKTGKLGIFIRVPFKKVNVHSEKRNVLKEAKLPRLSPVRLMLILSSCRI